MYLVMNLFTQSMVNRVVTSFAELEAMFLSHFMASKRQEKSNLHLLSITQQEGESLYAYIQRFHDGVLIKLKPILRKWNKPEVLSVPPTSTINWTLTLRKGRETRLLRLRGGKPKTKIRLHEEVPIDLKEKENTHHGKIQPQQKRHLLCHQRWITSSHSNQTT